MPSERRITSTQIITEIRQRHASGRSVQTRVRVTRNIFFAMGSLPTGGTVTIEIEVVRTV